MIKGTFFGWLLVFSMAVFLFSGCSGKRPPHLGVKDNRLSPCPSSPNCVSSQSDDEKRRIDPLYFFRISFRGYFSPLSYDNIFINCVL